MITKFVKFSTTHLRNIVNKFKYQILNKDYDAENFWRKRHLKYGFDLRGVGHVDMSLDKNEEMYKNAGNIFLHLCNREGLNFSCVRALDVGCGNGFYAHIFKKNGGVQYLGIDITDTLLPELRQMFPDFQFCKLDVSRERLDGKYDLIWMIDVSQHIVDDAKFSFAMQNIKSSLSSNGVFVVTSYLNEDVRTSAHVVRRSMTSYLREFTDYTFSEPILFRDKYIFTIRRLKA